MKLNCDLGEGFGAWVKGLDSEIMPHIDLANIACGFHASDPVTMQKTINLAQLHNVTIGAHPGYPDLIGFGRRSMKLSPQELSANLLYQIGALQSLCLSQQTKVCYVKPHGALYNDMMADPAIFTIICQTLTKLPSKLPLIVQALPDTSAFRAIAKQYKISLWFEAFADREYQDNGLLVERSHKAAVIHDADKVVARCQYLLEHQQLLSINNQPLSLTVDTLCVHGDNPTAVALAQKLSKLLHD